MQRPPKEWRSFAKTRPADPSGLCRYSTRPPSELITRLHLAGLRSYLEADEQLCALYANRNEWARGTILNVAGSGKFSSDRTIAEYAEQIWNVKPCPI